MAWDPPSNVAPNDILTSTLWNQSVVDNTKAIVIASFNVQTGTTYTPVLEDSYNKIVTLDNASAITVTIPAFASVAYETGAVLNFMQKGAGQVTFSPAGSVTLNSQGGQLKMAGQWAMASMVKIAENTWVVYGNLSP